MDPGIRVELMYATTNNFLGKNVYDGLDKCYLRLEAAVKLTNAAHILSLKRPGFRLLVYDGLRPRRVQYQMWEMVKDTSKRLYVANPKTGSIHNYGAAVDLTIIDQHGVPLDMGTPFDYFGPRAEPRYERYFLDPSSVTNMSLDFNARDSIIEEVRKNGPLTPLEIGNRQLLRGVMRDAGFEPIVNEWWHFNAFPPAETRKKFNIIE
jgi:D-alanyl-D-alanine dipeptidase